MINLCHESTIPCLVLERYDGQGNIESLTLFRPKLDWEESTENQFYVTLFGELCILRSHLKSYAALDDPRSILYTSEKSELEQFKILPYQEASIHFDEQLEVAKSGEPIY